MLIQGNKSRAISLIIHNDSEPNLLVRACNQVRFGFRLAV